MKISEFILNGQARLRAASLQCADPLLHLKQLVQYALGLTTSQLYLKWDDELSAADLHKLERSLGRRMGGEPFQYITGEEGFWKHPFRVGPGVLIPRRETELLVEIILREESRAAVRIGELGPGSGNIGISVLGERPDWEWHAFEINPASLPYLSQNRENLLSGDARYHVHEGDFFARAASHGPYDWIVTNPPYVSSTEMQTLPKEVRHEPIIALDGGTEGLEVLVRLADTAPKLLRRGGGFLAEIGSRQGDAVRALFAGKGFSDTEILVDYAGLPRVVFARWRG